MRSPTFGVLFSGNFPLQRSLAGAVLAEQLGFDVCWLGEDYFYHGLVSTATAVAERTHRIQIGLGVVSPVPRHPALTAMEVGTLDEISAGRVVLGIGYGVPAWLKQMGLGFRSPLSAMREGVELCRRLLAGETISEAGKSFSLEGVHLGFTPRRTDMPIYLGVEGPKGLELSGEVADGTIISVLAGPRYLEWALGHIKTGCERSGRSPETHRLIVYVIFSMDRDSGRARDAVRHTIAEYVGAGASGGGDTPPLLRLAGVPDDVVREMGRIYRSGRFPVELVDDAMVEQLAISGNPEECEAGVRRLLEAGADEVAFFTFPSDDAEGQIRQISEVLLPRLTN